MNKSLTVASASVLGGPDERAGIRGLTQQLSPSPRTKFDVPRPCGPGPGERNEQGSPPWGSSGHSRLVRSFRSRGASAVSGVIAARRRPKPQARTHLQGTHGAGAEGPLPVPIRTARPGSQGHGGGRAPGPRGPLPRPRPQDVHPRPSPSGAHLHALLVALEEVGAGVPGAVALEEFLGKPAVEALVVLALHIGAGLPHAVHGDQPGSGRCGAAFTSSRRAAHVTWERPRKLGSGDVASDAAGGAAGRGSRSRQLPERGERPGEGREPRERRADRAPGAPGPGRFPKPGRRGAATSGHRVRGPAPRRGHDWRGAHGVGAGRPVPVPTSGPRGGRQLCGRPAPELSPDRRGVLCGPPR